MRPTGMTAAGLLLTLPARALAQTNCSLQPPSEAFVYALIGGLFDFLKK